METRPPDHEQREGAQQPRTTTRRSGAGSAVKVALAAILGGTVGGVGYTVHQQNELGQKNEKIERALSDEQMLREEMQCRFDESWNNMQRWIDEQITLSDLDEVAEMTTPGCVAVYGPEGTGSGWLISDRDSGHLYIVTNFHVTDGNEFRVGEMNEPRDASYAVDFYSNNDFRDKKEKEKGTAKAFPVGRPDGRRAHSFLRDLAVLQLSPETERDIREGKIKARPLTIRDVHRHPLRVGEPVITIGNPFGERHHVAGIGIVSHPQAFGDIEPENVFIRVSAPVNPGNSGGPVIVPSRENGELVGQVAGMNTWGYMGGDGVNGAIDVRVIQLELDEFGITTMDPEQKEAYKRWWKDEIEPWQKKWHAEQKTGETMPPVPPADEDPPPPPDDECPNP